MDCCKKQKIRIMLLASVLFLALVAGSFCLFSVVGGVLRQEQQAAQDAQQAAARLNEETRQMQAGIDALEPYANETLSQWEALSQQNTAVQSQLQQMQEIYGELEESPDET